METLQHRVTDLFVHIVTKKKDAIQEKLLLLLCRSLLGLQGVIAL